MKKNISNFYRFAPVLLLIVLISSGCNRQSKLGSVLGARNTPVTDDGAGSRPGGRNIDNVPPIGNGGGINPINTSPIPVTDGGLANGDGETAGSFGANMDEDRSKFETQTVYFDLDKSNIKPTEVEKIRTVATHLKANASHKVIVEGHCDERGTEEYNRALGQRRADTVREFLAREGVPPDRIRPVSFGEDRPSETGHSEAA